MSDDVYRPKRSYITFSNLGGPQITWYDRNRPRPDPEADARNSGAITVNTVAKMASLGRGLPETFFDHNLVPEENRREVHALRKNLKSAFGRHLTIIAEIGEAIEARDLIGHGNVLPELQAEFRSTYRTARGYMALVRFFRGETKNISIWI